MQRQYKVYRALDSGEHFNKEDILVVSESKIKGYFNLNKKIYSTLNDNEIEYLQEIQSTVLDAQQKAKLHEYNVKLIN